MTGLARIGSVGVVFSTALFTCAVWGTVERPQPGLRQLSAFARITDRRARSLALFGEAGLVLRDPRCLNCHPRSDRPNQGDDGHPHLPVVRRGSIGEGVAGLHCRICHQNSNTPLVGATVSSIPGNPRWRLAPPQMAWEGKSLGAICALIKNPRTNGGRSLAQLADHMAHDPLVGWAWRPGPGRRPAKGSQAAFGALIRAWIATGAACPSA